MSLMIYDKISDIPSTVRYVHNPSLYFETGELAIPDTEEVRHFLKVIDNAIYFDEQHVSYPWKIGAYQVNCLSGGIKALLCIYCNPDICFNANCCGANVLSQIIHFTKGHIYLAFPFFAYTDWKHSECDVTWRGMHFTDVYDFMGCVSDTLKEEEN